MWTMNLARWASATVAASLVSILAAAIAVDAQPSRKTTGEKSVQQFQDSLIETELRTPPNGFQWNNFYLYVQPQRGDLQVTARCFLWQNGQNVGRIPLARARSCRG